MNKTVTTSLVIGIILYLASTVGSYYLFAAFQKPGSTGNPISSPLPTDKDGKVVFDQNQPKTESCPLNGAMFSKQQRQWWEQHRPMGVMIENHEDARPQSGLSSADVVYEAVAEGGITRFMGVFYCQDGGMVGPVRSARTYFIDMDSEYGNNPLYVHVGGANTDGPANALGQLDDYGWTGKNDINQFSVGFPTFWRDYERLGHTVATEHTMYSTTQKLWQVAVDRKLTNVDANGVAWNTTFTPWQFKDELPANQRGTKSPSYDFWSGYKAYAVKWDYDPQTNLYKRTNGGAPHIDKDNGQQLAVKNVIVLDMKETQLKDDEHHNLYGTIGSGKAYFFANGNVTVGTWQKQSRTSRMKFIDSTGKSYILTRGQIWISIIPSGNEVTY